MKKQKGRQPNENLVEGLINLETGEEPNGNTCTYYPSMKAAAHSLKIDIAILRDARSKDCPAFRSGGIVHREQLATWLKKNPPQTTLQLTESSSDDEEFSENYDIANEAGGVGQTLKSLLMYERRLKRKLDEVEKSTKFHPLVKRDMVKAAMDVWLKVSQVLLKYELSVDTAKRESGELIPLFDAVKGIQALLAWHTVATSDALRNVIPELEGKTKFQIASLLDPALRSSIYRNFKLGMRIGKIPDWMGKAASEFVKSEEPLMSEKKTPSTNLDDY